MEDHEPDSTARKGTVPAGLSVFGALLTGAGGLFGGLVATGSGEFMAGGVYLIAAAFAFGLLANAVFRD